MAPSAISYREFTLFCVWDIAPFCFQRRGWQGDRFLRTPGNVSEFTAQGQSIQSQTNKLGSGLPRWTIFLPDLVGKSQQLLDDGFWLDEAIRLVLREDVPDRNQQFAGNGNNRFVVSQARFQRANSAFQCGCELATTCAASIRTVLRSRLPALVIFPVRVVIPLLCTRVPNPA